jgi:hypothetical protein
MKYLVKITSTNPSIGAKERSATFSNSEDAHRQFKTWMTWLDAELNHDMCDFLHTWHAENRETGYTLTMQEIPDENKCKTCQDIDYDTRS